MAPSLMTMIRDSVAEPRETAERLLALRPGLGVVIQAAVLVSVVDVLVLSLLGGGAMALPTAEGQVLLPPFAHAALLLASLVLSAGALQVGGQILGGRGRFEQALLLVVWLEVIMIAVQLVTLLGALALPPLAGLLGLLGLAVLLWCLVHFTRVLHGFQGFGRTVAALLIGATAVLFALTGILAMLGVGGPPNV